MCSPPRGKSKTGRLVSGGLPCFIVSQVPEPGFLFGLRRIMVYWPNELNVRTVVNVRQVVYETYKLAVMDRVNTGSVVNYTLPLSLLHLRGPPSYIYLYARRYSFRAYRSPSGNPGDTQFVEPEGEARDAQEIEYGYRRLLRRSRNKPVKADDGIRRRPERDKGRGCRRRRLARQTVPKVRQGGQGTFVRNGRRARRPRRVAPFPYG